MKRFGAVCGLLVTMVAGFVRADDPASKSPATQPTAIVLGDKQSIDANIGKQVMVEGVVSDAEWSKTGAVFLIKFKEGEATQFQGAMFAKFRDDMEKALGGDLSNLLEGAKIRTTGKLQMYREHPEILITDPKQITILAKGPGNSPHAGAPRQSERLYGVYGSMTTLTPEQRAKIAAIQKAGHEAELEMEKKIAQEQEAKIAELLSDEQKEQLKVLKTQAAKSKTGDADND